MKFFTVSRTIIMLLSGTACGLPDSVTWIERVPNGTLADRTLNGVLQQMSGGNLELEARFQSGNKVYKIPIDQVRRIEFNARYYNLVAPPQVSALGEGPKAEPTAPVAPLRSYAIEIRGSGGDLVPCKVTSIDKDNVQCEAQDKSKPKVYGRDTVLRILVKGN